MCKREEFCANKDCLRGWCYSTKSGANNELLERWMQLLWVFENLIVIVFKMFFILKNIKKLFFYF